MDLEGPHAGYDFVRKSKMFLSHFHLEKSLALEEEESWMRGPQFLQVDNVQNVENESFRGVGRVP